MSNNKQDHIGEANKMVSSVDMLWDMIPKDTQNYIAKQFDGYNSAKNTHQTEVRFAFSVGKVTILNKVNK